tara:strand:- start:8708 stop:9187 length:480 start_codon:yes stop_codon:yes gene_type:complete
MKNSVSIYLFITILLSSCTKEMIQYYSFPEKTWYSEENVKFNIHIEDTTRLYSLDFAIRHTTSYTYQNIIFFTHHYHNDMKISTDTFNIDLADLRGKWYGKGKRDIRELNGLDYQVDKFYKKGAHTFELELAMRDNNNIKINQLNHISDISLFVLDINE